MIGCLFVILSIFVPRLILLLWYLFGSLTQGFQGWFWPLMGFLFMPFTTLVYAASHIYGEGIQGGWFALMILAVIWDVGGTAKSISG